MKSGDKSLGSRTQPFDAPLTAEFEYSEVYLNLGTWQFDAESRAYPWSLYAPDTEQETSGL